MNIRELVAHIEADERLVILGPTTDGQLIIQERRSGIKTAILLSNAYLQTVTWEVLQPILRGEREPNPIYHVSRVCGYNSRIENWNASKIAELHDRHKGQYGISGSDAGIVATNIEAPRPQNVQYVKWDKCDRE